MTWIQKGAVLIERSRIVHDRTRGQADDERAHQQHEQDDADLDAALVSFDRAVEREPQNWTGYFNRALIHGRKALRMDEAGQPGEVRLA